MENISKGPAVVILYPGHAIAKIIENEEGRYIIQIKG